MVELASSFDRFLEENFREAICLEDDQMGDLKRPKKTDQLLCDCSALAKGYSDFFCGILLLTYLVDNVDSVVFLSDCNLSVRENAACFWHLEDVVRNC